MKHDDTLFVNVLPLSTLTPSEVRSMVLDMDLIAKSYGCKFSVRTTDIRFERILRATLRVLLAEKRKSVKAIVDGMNV